MKEGTVNAPDAGTESDAFVPDEHCEYLCASTPAPVGREAGCHLVGSNRNEWSAAPCCALRDCDCAVDNGYPFAQECGSPACEPRPYEDPTLYPCYD